MFYFPGNVIENIKEKELNDFLAREHRENRFLDYKLKYEQKDKTSKKEFLKDITALANSQGGNLIIGVEEVKKEGVTLPGKLIGIEDGPSFVNSYRDLCNDAIDPRIHGLVIKDIHLSNKRWAVIVYVPPSLRRPHMAGLQKRFYIRRDDKSVPMTTDEIKGAVMEIVSLEKSILEYKEMVQSELMNSFLGGHFGFMMHAIPLVLEEGQVDTNEERIKNTLQDKSLSNRHISLIALRKPAPTLYGIMGECERGKHYFQTYIHSNGYVGLVFDYKEILIDPNDRRNKVVHDDFLRDIFLSFLRLCNLVTEQAMLFAPYQVHCEFKNAEGARHFLSIHENRFGSLRNWELPEIKLPPIRVDSFEKSEDIANYFFGKLRNAFGLE